jgi:uncharacterized protein
MKDLLTALALVLVIEGVVYSLFPGFVRMAARMAETQPEKVLRLGGLAAVIMGVGLVYLLRVGL